MRFCRGKVIGVKIFLFSGWEVRVWFFQIQICVNFRYGLGQESGWYRFFIYFQEGFNYESENSDCFLRCYFVLGRRLQVLQEVLCLIFRQLLVVVISIIFCVSKLLLWNKLFKIAVVYDKIQLRFYSFCGLGVWYGLVGFRVLFRVCFGLQLSWLSGLRFYLQV